MRSTSLALEFKDIVNNEINQPFQASYIGQYLADAGLISIEEIQKINKQHYVVHGNLRAFKIAIDTVVDLPFCEIKELNTYLNFTLNTQSLFSTRNSLINIKP